MKTKSDCEVILHMYNKFGMQRTLCELNGEFAFVLYDRKNDLVIAGRDQFGVRPLFFGQAVGCYCFGSELKNVLFIYDDAAPSQFPPGQYWVIKNGNVAKYTYFSIAPHVSTNWDIDFGIQSAILEIDNNLSFKNALTTIDTIKQKLNVSVAHARIRSLLTRAVDIRLMSDRPVGCLLSGGLDSSLITSLLSRRIPFQCFSIGLKDGMDIAAAKKVVDYLEKGGGDIKHHIVEFTVDEGFDAIEDVIFHLESYDITTIRASTPQYLLSKYISQKTDVRVIYSGEGADELFAGYQYSKTAPTHTDLYYDTARLLGELHFYDNLRTDRTTAAFGLEVRVPFLDKNLVKYVMSLPPAYRECNNRMEKTLLRNAFNVNDLLCDNRPNFKYLPDEILWRKKEAFSDAVSSKNISWYGSVQQRIDKIISDSEFKKEKVIYEPQPPTKEALYYRRIYEKMYGGVNAIPGYWMPKWQKQKIMDPSATVLDCHEGDCADINNHKKSLQR
jgi:asparagine synthase (glutamine-hydrolysing)